MHTFGIESVGGLVEDEHRWLAEKGGGQAEALAHAERETADTSAGVLGHGHLVERLIDPLGRQSRGRGEDTEMIDRPATRVEAGGFQHGTDLAGGLVEIDVASPSNVAVPAVGVTRPSSMRSVVVLPAPLGPRRPGDGSRTQLEGQAVDGGHGSEALGEAVQLDGGHDLLLSIGSAVIAGSDSKVPDQRPIRHRAGGCVPSYSPGRMSPLS